MSLGSLSPIHYDILLLPCLLPVAVIIHLPKPTFGEKGLFGFWVTVLHERKPRQKLKAGTQKQELKERPWKKALYEPALSYLAQPASPCHPEPPAQVWHQLQ